MAPPESCLGASDAKLINAVYYRSPRSLSFGIDALSKTALPPSTIGPLARRGCKMDSDNIIDEIPIIPQSTLFAALPPRYLLAMHLVLKHRTERSSIVERDDPHQVTCQSGGFFFAASVFRVFSYNSHDKRQTVTLSAHSIANPPTRL